MIQLNRFIETMHEIRGMVNAAGLTDAHGNALTLDKVIVSPQEEHLVKKLKDAQGNIMAVSYPSSDGDGSADYCTDESAVLIFIIRKVDPSRYTDAEEREFYADMQRLTLQLRDTLRQQIVSCDFQMQGAQQMRIEWEYNIYGGFCGLSVGFKLIDHN